jgi:hypothetical protein
MKGHKIEFGIIFIFSLLLAAPVLAQRISFGLYATEGIVLSTGSVDELDFNSKQPLIVAGSTVTISLIDNSAAVLTITGRADLDVTISIDAPATLNLDDDNSIPLSIGFAYSNLGLITESEAKTQAVEIPAGFNSATLPMFRRAGGPPGPPPTPSGGQTLPTITTYIFIYGTLGPVPAGSSAGDYTGEINVHVEYSVFN